MGKKKKKTEKKERQVWTYGTTPVTSSIELAYDSLTDSISFFPHEEGSLKIVSSYERKPVKKEKSLVSVPCIGASSLNVNQDLKIISTAKRFKIRINRQILCDVCRFRPCTTCR
jgi:hypothetical protein